LLDWLGDARKLVLLSKADKLSRAEQAATLKKVRASVESEVRLFSSLTRQGVEECRDLLDRSERKRGRAAADLSAASRSRGDFDDAAGSDPRNTPAVQAAAARLRAIHS